MKGGFFSTITESKITLPLIPQCGSCGLYKTCKSPKMPVYGKGKRKVLIIGEAPGETEDERGIPFCGKSGNRLNQPLDEIDIVMERDCWVTNSLICRPPNNKYPDKSLDYCRPNIINLVKELKPISILCLGAKAVQSLIGWLWKEKTGTANRFIGWEIPVQSINTWVHSTWHPSFILRSSNEREVSELIQNTFDKHVKRAFRHKKRPFDEMPNYKQKVLTITDEKEAVWQIKKFLDSDTPAAFDYETTTLKPDSKHSLIYSCAISDGDFTIAYPWTERTKNATWEFLQSDIGKIAANMKFEERWTLKEFGKGVNNWKWDTMLAAHMLNNTPKGMTGLKFQSFVRLGQDSYDDDVKPYLISDGSNTENRIREAPLNKVLLYNGMDAILEWHLAAIQSKQIGVVL